jgi:hypothetical protein
MAIPDTNFLTFYILTLYNIKGLSALPVDELAVLVLEYLPPSRVGAPDLHVVGSSRVLNVEGLVVVSGSDGQRLLMEVPDLGSSSISCLDDHVSIVDQVEVFSTWEC